MRSASLYGFVSRNLIAVIALSIAFVLLIEGGTLVSSRSAPVDGPPLLPEVATTLAAGDIAIVGVNSDGTDNFSFVALRDIGSATVINFTDRSWNGSAFVVSAPDSTVIFTAATNITTGTVVSSHNSAGALNSQFSAALNLDEAGDHILAYQGTDATPTFLYAINFGDLNTTFAGTVPTGLAVGTNAVAIAGDNASFAGPTTARPANTTANLLLDVSDFNSWAANDNSPQVVLSGTYLSAPDQQVWVASSGGGAGLIRINRDGVDTGSLQITVFQNSPTPPTQLNHPNEILFDTVHGLYFVADSDTGNRRILQGNIADLLNNPGVIPTFTVLYTDQTAGSTGGQINGLAIDVDGSTGTSQGHLYFVNKNNFNRITYNYNGASATNQTATLLAQLSAGSFANEIALDIANNRAFVLSTASNTEAVADPTDPPPCQPPNQLDEDPDPDICYFSGTNITNNEIWRVTGLDRTDTSTAQTAFARLTFPGGDNGGQDLQDVKGLLQGMDIDPAANMLYFVSQQINNGAGGATGGIHRYNLVANTYETLFTEGDATDYSFEYIDVDPGSGRYYVSNVSFDDANNLANTSSILVHALSAGAPTHFATSGNINASVGLGLIVTNAPTLTLTQLGATPSYTEQSGSPSAAGPGVTLISSATANDLDTAPLTDELSGATVRISNNFVSGDSLTFTNSGGITGAYNSSTGVLTFTGASTFANYQTVLASVKFTNAGDNPTVYGTNLLRTIAWSVSDGLLSSDEQTSTISVVGVNDAPVNAFPGAQVVNEDTNLSIPSLSVSDADADPASQQLTTTLSVVNGTLTVLPASGAGVSGSGSATVILTGTRNQIHTTLSAANNVVYRGLQDYFGSDTLTYTTNDQGNTGNDPGLTGTATTEQDQDLIGITVNPVNDAPTLNVIANPVPILEDAGAQTVNLAGISEGPANESSQTLIVAATSNNPGLIPNPTASFVEGNATGSLDYTPVANAFGSAIITVTITDNGGTANSGVNLVTRTFTVNVTPVNDAPTLTAIGDQNILEDATVQTVNLAGISNGPNETGQINTITATSDNTAVVPNPAVSYTSPNATGSLTYTPVANMSGSAIITVTISDNGGLANSGADTLVRTFTVFVTAVNDAPTLDAINNPAAILEDATQQTVNLAGISEGPANESSQTLTVAATSSNTGLIPNPTATFLEDSTTGSLSYTPVANAFGSAIITVTVTDNGDTANSGVNLVTRTFTVNVTAVNDAPTLTAIGDENILEDATLQTVNLAGISNGPNETGQTNTITATSDNTGLIPNPAVSYTSPNATGSLTYTPVANVSGSALITVTISDSGGTLNSGADTLVRTFTVNVAPVNDAPSFTKGPNDSVPINFGARTRSNWATNILKGPADESGQTLTFNITNNTNTALFSVLPSIDPSTGTLTYTTANDASGSATLTLTLSDDGNSVAPDANTSAPETFVIGVGPTAADGAVTGRIMADDGTPVEGAVVRLSGTQNRKFITDANGVYRFDQVGTGGFYNVTPSRVNYTFSPAVISFSQLGETTEAAFGATATGSNVNPLDTPEYFVRQNYLDFLGREPDEAGFNFWSDQILGCGDDTDCVDRKRTHVSAAYFLSIEFQETGGLVDGLYRASYGRRPSYGEFRPDAAAVAPGLVVGSDNWATTLENGKAAFVDAFVQRAAFQSAYGGLANDAYVDALIANTGVNFTSAERSALLSALGNGTTRAQVLRAIVENPNVVAAKRNEAFVMMEYFGYLRREPDAGGYQFWLDKLNHFNGNFEQAEMVRAFIVSQEYRERFKR